MVAQVCCIYSYAVTKMPILEHFGQNAHLHEKVYHLDIYKQGISAHFEWSLSAVRLAANI